MYLQATTHTNAGKLIWDTDGYYAFGDDSWKDITIEARMVYQGGEMGLIPRFDSTLTYVAFTIGNYPNDIAGTVTTANLFGQMSSETQSIGTKELAISLVVGQEYVIKAEVRRTNYRIYLDGSLIFNAEFNRIYNGSAAAYGTAGTECTLIQAEAPLPDGWNSNVDSVSGALITLKAEDNGDRYFYLNNPTATTLELWQDIVIAAGGDYALSFSYKGTGTATLTLNTGDTISQVLPQVNVWTRYEVILRSAQTTAVSITSKFILGENEELSINNVQVEQSTLPTTYIHNESTTESISRGSSFITYPAKGNINGNEGSVSLWFLPTVNYDNTNLSIALFEYGNADGTINMNLTCTSFFGNNISVGWGDQSTMIGLSGDLREEWCHVVLTWSSDMWSITFNDARFEFPGSGYTFSGTSDVISIGHNLVGSAEVFTGMIDDVIIFSKALTAEEITILYNAKEPIADTQQMLLRGTFNHAIGNFNKSVIEMTPAPLYGSPVIVTKQDKTVMEKVSFFDPYTGGYKTSNTESSVYDGKLDYIRVGYDDLDNENFKITVKDYSGVLIGSPYQAEKNKVFITLSDDEKKDLRGQTLYVTYQPENAYTVDFNINQPDSFRVSVGKHDGQPLTVDYEGNRFSNEKLVTMVELNPLLNPNHQGFMYIVQSPQSVSTFRAKVSPQDIPADGVSEAIIVIEPLDNNGNFVSHVKLEVTAVEGSIVANHDPGSLSIRETAGRYMYRYRAPKILLEDRNVFEVPDMINVIDTVSKMGIQVPITLVLASNYNNSDETPSAEATDWNVISMYLLREVDKYYGKLVSEIPAGLGTLIDFNGDGQVDFSELGSIYQLKYTKFLDDRYLAIKDWYRTHT
jgi:hypothetical protein